MTRRVFISKPEHEVISLREKLILSNRQLIAESFITFETSSSVVAQEVDIIFFGSTRSIIFLRAKMDIGIAKDIACVGSRTAVILTEMGYPPSFVGTNPGSPKDVAEEFKLWCGERRVLFPISNRSLRSISKVFPPEQIEELTTYRTNLVRKKVDPCDVYVFTSPSNMDGFLLENRIPENAMVIAWGDSTKEALEEMQINVHHTLKNSSMKELKELLTK